jgi:hypothetical protein
LSAPPAGFVPQPLPTSGTAVVRPVKQKKGLTAGLKNAWDKATAKAQTAWNSQTDDRFRKYFGFPYTEQLFGEFWGEIWSGGQMAPCSVYLSSNWICIEAKTKDPVTRTKMALKTQISIRDIIRIQRACSLPSMSGGSSIIQPVTDPSVKTDSLQVFTRDGMLHQFGRFFNYEKFVATLEYLWHTATQSQGTQAGGYQPVISTAAPNTVPLHQPTLVKQYQPAQAVVHPPTGTPYH